MLCPISLWTLEKPGEVTRKEAGRSAYFLELNKAPLREEGGERTVKKAGREVEEER